MHDNEHVSHREDAELNAPFLTLLVNFSGLVLAIGGSLAVVLAVGSTARGGDSWIVDLLVVLVLAAVHVALRLLRRQRRRSRGTTR